MNIYEKWVPLTTVKMVHGGPKKGGSVNITTQEMTYMLSTCWKQLYENLPQKKEKRE